MEQLIYDLLTEWEKNDDKNLALAVEALLEAIDKRIDEKLDAKMHEFLGRGE